MKHLPKHLRPRWRYLAVAIETWPTAEVGRRGFQRELWYAGQNLLGDPGGADADLQVMQFAVSAGGGGAVVRTRRGSVDAARAAIACLDEVDGHPVGLRVSGVSGTVDACSENYLGNDAGFSVQSDVTVGDATVPAWRRNGALDVREPTGFIGATVRDFE
jgi:ribonuclease P/MRP protein subunit POP5